MSRALPASYRAAFAEDEGYLNFASFGPPSRQLASTVGELLAEATTATVGASERLHAVDEQARSAFARLSGFRPDQVALLPGTTYGIQQLAFGVRGTVLVSSGEFPANVYPWLRAQQAGLATVAFMGGLDTPVTAELVAAALTPQVTALAVSAVDFRTGYRADLSALRTVLGPDRLLFVDANQGFGALAQDWTVADVVLAGSQKWVRGGWGAGAMACSDAALAKITPTLGGWTGVQHPTLYDGAPHPPLESAHKFHVTHLSPFASGAFASALELIEEGGIGAIDAQIAATAGTLIEKLTDAGIPLLSPVAAAERAGIVVAGFPDANAAAAQAALAEAGMTVSLHGPQRLRLSVHATTEPSTLSHAALILAGFA